MGEGYPKFESSIYADGSKTIVTVSRTLSPNHVNLDSPGYIENKLKKRIPILTSIGVTKNKETDEQSINVTVEVGGAFNGITHLTHLVHYRVIYNDCNILFVDTNLNYTYSNLVNRIYFLQF